MQSHALSTTSPAPSAPVQNLLPVGEGGYELISKIKTGGMAEVFLARRIGRVGTQSVVVKKLREDVQGDPSIVRMFAWEAWICCRLCHPNIVRFYDFTHSLGHDYLVLEHVPGADLAALIRSTWTAGAMFGLDAVLDVGIAIARALEYAHRTTDDFGRPIGLVHRDVSPQNILVSRDGEVKLIDFGVAKTASDHIPRDTIRGLKGKIGYVSPEQLRGQPADARSDVYALGVVLYEMIAGRRLYRRTREIDTLRAILNAEIPVLSHLRRDCPDGLSAAVHRALTRDPDARFDSAGEMQRTLSALRATLSAAPDGETLARLVGHMQAVLPPESQTSGPWPSTLPPAVLNVSDIPKPGDELSDTLREGALVRSGILCPARAIRRDAGG